VLDVKIAKEQIVGIVDKTNQLIQSVYAGALEGTLFVAVNRSLQDFCEHSGFCLMVAVDAKQRINEQKYPPKENQGILTDYKLLSSVTGINKETASEVLSNLPNLHWVGTTTVEWMDGFLLRSKRFVKERNWLPYDHPRMLCLAMIEEVGELCGVLKFVSDNEGEVSCSVYGNLVSEICDIFIYFCRLSDACGFFGIIKMMN